MRCRDTKSFPIFLVVIGILLFFMQNVPASPIPAVTITSPGIASTSGMVPYAVYGFQFQPNRDILVTQLGMFDYNGDGFVNTHSVGLWSELGALLTSVVLTPNDPGFLLDGFRYHDITPLRLESGTYFRIAADYASGPDEDKSDSDILPLDTHVFSTDITWLNSAGAGASTAGLEFPWGLGASTGNQPSAILGPNFLFEPVPEPSTWILLSFGLIGLAVFKKRLMKKPKHG